MSAPRNAALAAAEWRLAGTQRATIYGWFAGLYAAEVAETALQAYVAGAATPLLDGLAALGLEAETARLQAAIESLRDISLARLELAADFAQLFLLDGHQGALPYASAHDGHGSRLCGSAETRMRALLAERALTLDAHFREPADHLAVHLAVLARQIGEQAEAGDSAAAARAQLDFLDQRLLGWLPRFAEGCARGGARFDFYPALAALLLAFLRADRLFLHDVAGAGSAHHGATATGTAGS